MPEGDYKDYHLDMWRESRNKRYDLIEAMKGEAESKQKDLFTIDEIALLNKGLGKSNKVGDVQKAVNSLCLEGLLKPLSKNGFRHYQLKQS